MGDTLPVTVIQDSPGFISQRVLATIVNIACDIAQRGHLIGPGEYRIAVLTTFGIVFSLVFETWHFFELYPAKD